MKLVYQVNNETTYTTIKEVLKTEFSMSNRLLLKLKKSQNIYLNHEFTFINHIIKLGDIIECNLDVEEDISNIVPSKMNLDIIYEDDAFLLINKPVGIPVHPSIEHYSDSLSNGVRYYFDMIGLKKKIRPVNRIDKNTSGIVVFAKNEYIQECLIKQMKTKQFIKKYIAIIDGHLENLSGTINLPIARKENSIIERCVSSDGDTAITHYKVLKSKEISNIPFDIVECILETGRTHQIRVHFASIGHSLLGDTLYGSASSLISRQALHAYKIEFIHPVSKEKLIFEISPPNDFKNLM